jgi:hypothetical protein
MRVRKTLLLKEFGRKIKMPCGVFAWHFCLSGADGRTRTGTVLPPVDFEFYQSKRTFRNGVERLGI